MKTALILGHPGHELRVFRFLELHRPLVYVLTDGSGNNEGKSRIGSTEKIIRETGCQKGRIFGRFTDREMYDLMLQQSKAVFQDLMDELILDLKKQGVERLVGDACEGYNPTHDLCRYLINAIAQELALPNYDFFLEGPPNLCPPHLRSKALFFHLSEEDFTRKYAAAMNYPELKVDLEHTLGKYGKAPFLVECLRPVDVPAPWKTWETPLPYYETYALDKINQGKYTEVISFEKHIRPLAEELHAHSDHK